MGTQHTRLHPHSIFKPFLACGMFHHPHMCDLLWVEPLPQLTFSCCPTPSLSTQAGCKHCYDTPFASRPSARAKPKEGRYHNTLPPAPTFHPTAEEWQDPFAYLGSIAPEATKAGIALIVPPKGWEPPIQMLDQETGQLRTDLQVRVTACRATAK